VTLLIHRDCPICGPNKAQTLVHDANFDLTMLDSFAFSSRKHPELMHLRMVKCGDCDLLFANPVFGREFLGDAYQTAEFDSGVEAQFASHTYAFKLRSILDRLPDRCGAIDIGTGEGAFLERLVESKFSNVIGIEPSAKPIQFAKPGIRPLIRKELFEGKSFPSNAYSLVTCFQTIEHVPEPMNMAKEIFRILKPGAAVYLVGHNRRGLINSLLGKRSPIFDIEHLQLFSPASARCLLEAAGFVNVSVNPIVNTYPLKYWVKISPIPAKIRAVIMKFLKNSSLGLIPLSAPVGNLAIIGFKPGKASETSQDQ